MKTIFLGGIWGWQNPPHPGDPSVGPSGANVHNSAVPVQGQENMLSDMLQMMDQNVGNTSFEDLNIHLFNVNGPFE